MFVCLQVLLFQKPKLKYNLPIKLKNLLLAIIQGNIVDDILHYFFSCIDTLQYTLMLKYFRYPVIAVE